LSDAEPYIQADDIRSSAFFLTGYRFGAIERNPIDNVDRTVPAEKFALHLKPGF
jgi:hypothetical protein